MKIYSEKTNKEYATVDECVAAEKEFDEAVAKRKAEIQRMEEEKKAKAEKLQTERKARAAEVEDAYKASIEAAKHYQDLLDKFVKDYGSFHMTVHTGDLNPFNAFEIFNRFWL